MRGREVTRYPIWRLGKVFLKEILELILKGQMKATDKDFSE